MDDDQDGSTILFNPGAVEDEELTPGIPSFKPELDFPGASQIRHESYERIWKRLSHRSREVVRKFNTTLSSELAEFVKDAYDFSEFGPPPQLSIPVAVVAGGSPSTRSVIFDDALNQKTAYTTRVTAKDCTSLTNAMKSLVLGFLGGNVTEDDDEDDRLNHVGSSSQGPTLANYDLRLLEVRYKSKESRSNSSKKAKLVVVFPDVDAFDFAILESLIYACRLHIGDLPFVFLFGLSTSIDHLHRAMSREARACLDVTSFQAAGGRRLFNKVIDSLFFDPGYESGIVLGPHALDLVSQMYKQQSSSLDCILSTIQLLLLRHFSYPFSILCLDNPTLSTATPGTGDFFYRLRVRASKIGTQAYKESIWRQTIQDIALGDNFALLNATGRLRTRFFELVKESRMALYLLRMLRSTFGGKKLDPVDLYISLMDPQQREVIMKELDDLIRKKSIAQLRSTLQELQPLFGKFSMRHVNDDDLFRLCDSTTKYIACLAEEARDKATTTSSSNSGRGVDLSSLEAVASVAGGLNSRSRYAEEIASLFTGYISPRLSRFEETPLKEIWYVRVEAAASVHEMMNPSILPSITSALMRPHEFLQCKCCAATPDFADSLASLPDESVAFLRYLNSGKVVNVYDWFETFAMGLEGEDKFLPTSKPPEARGRSKGKTGRNRNAPEKEQRAKEDEEEQRKRILQARFLRCFHEFDYMGFLRQSGRKQDHVMRTVYDIAD